MSKKNNVKTEKEKNNNKKIEAITTSTPKKSGKKKFIIIGAAVLLVLAIAAAVIFFITKNNEPNQTLDSVPTPVAVDVDADIKAVVDDFSVASVTYDYSAMNESLLMTFEDALEVYAEMNGITDLPAFIKSNVGYDNYEDYIKSIYNGGEEYYTKAFGEDYSITPTITEVYTITGNELDTEIANLADEIIGLKEKYPNCNFIDTSKISGMCELFVQMTFKGSLDETSDSGMSLLCVEMDGKWYVLPSDTIISFVQSIGSTIYQEQY